MIENPPWTDEKIKQKIIEPIMPTLEVKTTLVFIIFSIFSTKFKN